MIEERLSHGLPCLIDSMIRHRNIGKKQALWSPSNRDGVDAATATSNLLHHKKYGAVDSVQVATTP